ncbi:S8 family serine peptidase [Bacillus sp. AFS029533]|uniref:S8 family serine peptidase n=1 Tax=Bacillus sp. AFS029533 TaxID=2033494 RepID=UPI000BFD9690|nr:S8 family serine peptidase [Bacillus sp. AFS029533]PGZ92974.1 hypothetical protein COE53_08955 [Bacillus sp. AFS029533]
MGKLAPKSKMSKSFAAIALSSSVVLAPLGHVTNVTKAESLSKAESILANLSPAQRQALEKLSTNDQSGLFLDENVNLESSSKVSVIVQFKNKPQKAAILEAAVKGETLSNEQAKANVELDHSTFKNDLEANFKTKSDGSFKIKRQYKNAFNGVALEVPANKVKDLLKSDAVQAIYSDSTVKVEEPTSEAQPSKEGQGQGMAAERSYLKIDKLHDEGYTGKGVKVAVLDTGVDYNHPDIKDAFKGGYDFVDNDNDPMETTYADWIKAGKPGGSTGAASYVTEHGTHVSGTIVGQGKNNSNYATTGIAPDADLYVYRVLGPGGSGTTENIIAAIDQAVADGMDVMNLSLGANYNDPLFPEAIAINNAVLSGVTAVVAAGNSGNGMYTVGSPGGAALALTVGASDVPSQIPTMKGHLDTANSDIRLLAKNFSDDISTLLSNTYDIVNIPGIGQASNYNNLNVTGKVVLVARGTSTINDKILQAKLKGAAAILIYNNNPDEGYLPYYLGEGTDFIPSFNLTNADGLALQQKITSGNTKFSFSDLGQLSTKGDNLADFSSRGPTRVNYEIKPEITAPGVSVLSTVPGFIHSPNDPTNYQYAYERMSGTSMATPFTTGVATLLKQANPDLQPEDIKSILMNTADSLSQPYSVFEEGAGRINPYNAIHSTIEIKVKESTPTIINGEVEQINIDTGALSFGNKAYNGFDLSDTRTVTLLNRGEKTKTFNIQVNYQSNIRGSKVAVANGVTVQAPTSVTLKGVSQKKLNIALNIPKTADKGIYEGYIVFTNKDNPIETYRIPFGVHYVEQGFQSLNLSRQSISTDRNNLSAPLYSPYLTANFTLKSHMRYIYAVLTDATTGEDLGISNAFDGVAYNEGVQYNIQPFMGYYYPFTTDSSSPFDNKPVKAKEGHYKMKLIGYDDNDKAFTIAQDLFVDNTMPNQFDVQVQGEKPGNPFIEYKPEQKTIPITASINDKIVDQMKAIGLKADQSQNYIGYYYNSFYLTGKLSLDENGKAKDEIAMQPNLSVLNVRFAGVDQATNFNGMKQYLFVKEGTPYVYGQANVATRLNQVNAQVGDKITVTLTANNLAKLQKANYNFTTSTLDTNIVNIALNPEAKKLGGQLNVTTTNLSSTTVKSNVDVTFDGTQDVSGDIPMVDVTIKIPELNDVYNYSSFYSVNSTFTSVDNVVTKPLTAIVPINILSNTSSVIGYIHPESFNNADGTLKYIDYTKLGANVTVVDSKGKKYTGTMDSRGQFTIGGLPVTKDAFTVVTDIPGHFTTYGKFDTAYNTIDGFIYGYKLRLGTETVDTATAGDINKDNVIDINDALAIETYWGTNKRSADINFDGTVDAKDFAYVEKNYLLQNTAVDNAPKPAKKYKGKTLADIKIELGIQ